MSMINKFEALAPFRVRSFRFQWPADLLTSWAFEMEMLVLGWYVLVTTDSVILLTAFGALGFIGTLVAPVFGMLGDRLGRRTMLCFMRAYYACLAVVTMILGMTDQLTPYFILAISLLAGLVRQSDLVMRNSLIGDTMPPEHLVRGIGLARTTQDTARIFGALAGAGLFAAFGIGNTYIVVAAFYVMSFLFSLGLAQSSRPEEVTSRWRELKEGFVYIWNTPRLLALMWLAFLINFSAFPFTISLLPFSAKEIYHVGEGGLGTLIAAYASGAFVGSVLMATTGGSRRPATFMFAFALSWYVLLAIFAAITKIELGLAVLFCIGIVQSFTMLSMSSLILGTAAAELRARVMGVRMLAVYGLGIGLPIAGVLIDAIGYVGTVWIFAAIDIIAVAAIALKWRRALWA
ncbi:MAG: MFS transporter [Alphaproteobacteria bacterium]|jgi:predicted MFS family arabinose efflux permease|nr:MFS transporter [Alphaproteobacteria bacterium]